LHLPAGRGEPPALQMIAMDERAHLKEREHGTPSS